MAVRAISDWMTAGEVSASVRPLVEGVLKTMLFSKLRTTAAVVCAMSFLTIGLGAVAWVVADDSNKQPDVANTAAGRPAFLNPNRPTAHAQGAGRLGTNSRPGDPHWPGECR